MKASLSISSLLKLPKITKLKTIAPNIYVATSSLAMTLLVDFLYRSIYKIEIDFNLLTIFIVSLIIFLATFCRSKFFQVIFINLFLILSLFQMGHHSFMGTMISSPTVGLLFIEIFEVAGALTHDVGVLFVPLGIVAFALSYNIYRWKKYSAQLFTINFVTYFLFIILSFYPLFVFITSSAWGREYHPRYLFGVNVYSAVSYYVGKILPAKINRYRGIELDFNPEFFSGEVALQKNINAGDFKGNILLIIGESVSPWSMKLLNPELTADTTPLLSEFKNDPNFFYQKGFSSGVSTDVTVSFLLNSTFGPNAPHVIKKGNQCLYNLAQKSNFDSFFISTQSKGQLKFIRPNICAENINYQKSLDDFLNKKPSIDEEARADDGHLLGELDLLLNYDQNDTHQKRKLVTFHMRGSHIPYNKRYPNEFSFFPISGDTKEDRLPHYYNSVRYLDYLLVEMINKIKSSPEPWIILYTSDHGQGLGENGFWGHTQLTYPAFHVPFVAYFHGEESRQFASLYKRRVQRFPLHFHLSVFLLELLGYFVIEPALPLPTYLIIGDDIGGLSGFKELTVKKLPPDQAQLSPVLFP